MGRRFFRHGELPLVLLALLSERPMQAYDLMSELGRLFGPVYKPSPGSIYPAVEALEAEGLIGATDDGARTIYALTPLGVDALDKRRHALGEFELRTGVRVTQRRSVEAALARFTAQVHSIAAYLDPGALEELLDQAVALIRQEVPKRRDGSLSKKER